MVFHNVFQFVLQGFNWTRFIQGVLSSVSIEVQLEEEVVVYGSPYLEKMNEVLSRHSVRSALKDLSRQVSMMMTEQRQSYTETEHKLFVCRAMQNYLTWQLITDRVNSLSRRFKDARARYRKVGCVCHKRAAQVCLNKPNILLCVCVDRLSTGPLWRMLGGENVSVMSRAAWRTQWELCMCARPLQERVREWWVFFLYGHDRNNASSEHWNQ